MLQGENIMNTPAYRCMALFLAAFFILLQSACGLGYVAEKTVAVNQAIGENIQQLKVSNTNGEIKIVGAETDALEVRAKITVRARTQKLADANLGKVDLVFDESGRDLILKANTPHSTFGISYIVNYEIDCPEDLAISMRSSNGKLIAEGMRGGVDVETTNGEIYLGGVSGKIKARTTNGRVHGNILSLSESGEFTTVNGQVDVRLHECNIPIHGSAVNGQVVVHLPANFAGRVDASVVNGNIRCEFDVHDEDSGRRHLRGRIGEGGDAAIRLSSVNGQVKIAKN
jgi:DUF4097 and DUF4098 domain-containing protein YvlB